MKAAELSAILARQGVPVLGHREGDEFFGGLIRVTDTIHVEIAEGGGAVVVKVLNDKEFQFYDRRTRVKDLIADLVKAGAVILH